MSKVRKSTALLVLAAALALVAPNAWAIPSLGVATTDGYLYTGASAPDYVSHFVTDASLIGPAGPYHGFVTGDSNQLIVFTNVTNVDIYLLWTTPIESAVNPSINGTGGTYYGPISNLDGYTPREYFGVNLGIASGAGWTNVDTNDPNDPFNGKYYRQIVLNLSFSGTLPYPVGQYFFAIADSDGISGPSSMDPFSPKTDSALVNEPSTMGLSLLGLGFVGLIYRRRKARLE